MPNPDDILSALRAALDANPDSLALRLHLARLLKEHERHAEAKVEYEAAVEQLETAISEQPADADLYEQLAEAQQALGDETGALTSLGIVLILRGLPAGNPASLPLTETENDASNDASIEEMIKHDLEILANRRRLGSSYEDDDVEPEVGLYERPTITFADVGGMEDIKERIRMAIIYPFQQPEVFAAYGKRAGGGILLYGPPGCGKTYIARATAGEVGARFISVGISDILDMWHGESERKLHNLFQSARRARPSVLFFDEIEALGGDRLDMLQHFQRTLVNQFLAELDGADGDNTDILVIGATNSPWHIDPALRRPGRFDRTIFVAPPDEAARREILHLHLRGKPAAENVDVNQLARETDAYSGADLRALVDRAAEEALKEAMRTGKIMPIDTAMLLRAVRREKPSTIEWFNIAKNYAIYSNDGGTYDEVAAYLKKRRIIK